jgi:hypothetical protein
MSALMWRLSQFGGKFSEKRSAGLLLLGTRGVGGGRNAKLEAWENIKNAEAAKGRGANE